MANAAVRNSRILTNDDKRAKEGAPINDVLDYIQEALGELPAPPDDVSWSGLAVHYLSCAVELWAHGIMEELAESIEEETEA